MILGLNKIDKGPVVIILIASVIRLMNPTLNSIILAVLFPAIMIWCVFKEPQILSNKFIIRYVLLMLWILFTTVSSIDFQSSVDSLKPILGGLVMSIFMYYLALKKMSNAYWLMIAYVLSFLATMYYLNSIGELTNLDTSKTRLSVEGVNANDLSYYLFYIAIVISLFKWQGEGGLGVPRVFVYILVVAVTLFISVITASRQVLIVVLPFIFISLFFRSVKKFNIRKLILSFLLLGILAYVGFMYFKVNYYQDSYLQLRMEEDVKEDSRVFLLQKAVEVGLNHPLFGVGPGNYTKFTGGSFSHCSYTELFATSGLIALLLFASIVFGFVKLNYIRYKKTHNRVFLYLFIASIGWAIYNVFYAFYTAPWLISFYFLLIGYSEGFYNKMQLKRNE